MPGLIHRRHGISSTIAAIVAALALTVTGSIVARAAAEQPADEFFIVSSIDVSKGQLLLKRPTEVTDVMRVDAATRYLDENGKSIELTDLRAGDTVFIRSKPGSSVAQEIRKGPMTTAELRRRYLQKK